MIIAITLHVSAYAVLYPHIKSQDVIASDVVSAPTQMTIQFAQIQQPITIDPIKQQKEKLVKTPPLKKTPIKTPPIEHTQPEKIIEANFQPETLNKIEPAATPPPLPAIPVIQNQNIVGTRVAPKYPRRALRLGQEGVVWLRVLVSETGMRQEINLHKASPYALLNQAALKAVKQWRFKPHTVNGKAVKSWIEIPVEFKIHS